THRWLKRCEDHFAQSEAKYGHEQYLFGIIQGSVYKNLREESAAFIAASSCSGHAIGGLSVGEPAEKMYEMTEIITKILPDNKPVYLMGVGTPVNILEGIALGVDMFDCVMPTRNGRNGMLFTEEGIINIRNNKWKDDFSAIDENALTFVDTQYSKAYLRHLFVAGEMLGPMIASLHNLGFYLWLMAEARKQINNGTFSQWKKDMIQKLERRI
ncbi:MAG: tRNA guanosine(34) transglycosylase Tgt, partial [Bacteroidales bacterium]|nr:tRNA guanosine(34) transglycosylase Tgt [Bacteroidales bacterium]